MLLFCVHILLFVFLSCHFECGLQTLQDHSTSSRVLLVLNSKWIQVMIKTHRNNTCGHKKCLIVEYVFVNVRNSFLVPTPTHLTLTASMVHRVELWDYISIFSTKERSIGCWMFTILENVILTKRSSYAGQKGKWTGNREFPRASKPFLLMLQAWGS